MLDSTIYTSGDAQELMDRNYDKEIIAAILIAGALKEVATALENLQSVDVNNYDKNDTKAAIALVNISDSLDSIADAIVKN